MADRWKRIIIAGIFILFVVVCYMFFFRLRSNTIELKTDVDKVEVELGGETAEVEVSLVNHGSGELPSRGHTFLSYHIQSSSGETINDGGVRAAFAETGNRQPGTEGGSSAADEAAPIEEGRYTLPVTAPAEAGEYHVEIDIVKDDGSWLSESGLKTIRIPMKVNRTYEPDYVNINLATDVKELNISQGDSIVLPVSVSNNSKDTPIYHEGEMASLLSYHIKDADGRGGHGGLYL